MTHRPWGTAPQRPRPAVDPGVDPGVFGLTSDTASRAPLCAATPGASCVTQAGADWLASACSLPASVRALWAHRPYSPSVLPCGTAFDVLMAPPLAGRRILESLWSCGPGSGPAAVHRGRVLLFAAPGTAQRLTALLSWDEWRRPQRPRPAAAEAASGSGSHPDSGSRSHAGSGSGRGSDSGHGSDSGRESGETFPSLLCLGPGDSVTIPALRASHQAAPPEARQEARPAPPRWLVAPDVRHPWLPGPEVLLRACVRSRRDRLAPRSRSCVRAGRGPASAEQPISGTADGDAKVYDVTRRR